MFSSLIGSLLSRESASLTSSSRAMSLWAHCAQAHALAVGVGDNEASLHESEVSSVQQLCGSDCWMVNLEC